MIGLEMSTGMHALTLPQTAPIALIRFDRVPNEEALALSPSIGWLFLLAAFAIVAMGIAHADGWRRWWLAREDPRSVGLWRIVFSFLVLCNVNGLYEHFRFLFTDEGIFTADVARQVFGAAQFKGFGDGFGEDDRWGFFDIAAVFEYLQGPKFSLLHFWDSPAFFYAHLTAFEIAGVLFMVGLFTRTSGILTFLLMNSILFRNHLFWEGTDVVFRVFLAYLICARSGHAYSVDNWLRCRRLKRQHLLSTRDSEGGGAGAPPSKGHPRGLQAIYRRIPVWPRRLAMIQLAVVYTFTGIVKNGSLWIRGDAIYYAWNMDHFYRFYPQRLSAIFGTNLLRLNTWVVHWGETLFFLCIFGALVHFAHEETWRPSRRWQRLTTHLGWAVIISCCAAILWITWPVHFTPAIHRSAFIAIFIGSCGITWAVWMMLDRWPIHISGQAAVRLAWGVAVLVPAWLLYELFPMHLVARGAQEPRIAAVVLWVIAAGAGPWGLHRLRGCPLWPKSIRRRIYVIDRLWVGRWILGRRIWITFHVGLMGGIFVLLNIGQFQTGMLAQAIPFFTGMEVAMVLRTVARRLPKWIPGISTDVRTQATPIPAEDPTLPHLRTNDAHLPPWALWTGLILFTAGIVVRILVPQSKAPFDWRWLWGLSVTFLAIVAAVNARNNGRRRRTSEPPFRLRQPWAYGPAGRFIIGALLCWHIIAVAVWVLPNKDSLGQWRPAARRVFSKWLTLTQTDQGWGMFAPNPPRSNIFLKVLITDQEGEIYDLRSDVYAAEQKPIPWIWNDRMRKMNRRIIGGESGSTQWYRKWYARYICRDWALTHDGLGPKKVELVKVWYRIPAPEEVATKGWYVPEDLYERAKAQRVSHTEHCQRTVMGQLPNWVRERHALPPLGDGWKYRPWLKHKRRKWDKKKSKTKPKPSQEG